VELVDLKNPCEVVLASRALGGVAGQMRGLKPPVDLGSGGDDVRPAKGGGDAGTEEEEEGEAVVEASSWWSVRRWQLDGDDDEEEEEEVHVRSRCAC
jgi:hypothetical protein